MNKLELTNQKWKLATCFLVCVLLFSVVLTYNFARGQASNTFTLESGIYPSATPDYTIYDESGTYYAKNRYGVIQSSNTDCGALLNALLTTYGKYIEFTNGTFDIDTLVTVDLDGCHFKGVGYGDSGVSATVLRIGASGGFSITHATDVLRDISFEGFFWDGDTFTAPFAITSSMPSNRRLDSVWITHNWFNLFDNVIDGSTMLLMNLENSVIERNTFYQTQGTHILLNSNGYSAGNIRIIANEFYYSYDRINENCVRSLDSTGGIYATENHYFGDIYPNYAYNVTTTGTSTCADYQFVNERVEGGGLIITDPYNSTLTISDVLVSNCRLGSPGINNAIMINFGIYTYSCIVDANKFSVTGTGCYAYIDNSTSTASYNVFSNNWVAQGSVAPSVTTHVFGNTGMHAYYIVKTVGTDSIRTSANNFITNFGSHYTTMFNTLSNNTVYIVRASDVYLSVSGGVVSSIEIQDMAGTAFVDLGSSATGYRIPWLYKFKIVWHGGVAPTIKFSWAS